MAAVPRKALPPLPSPAPLTMDYMTSDRSSRSDSVPSRKPAAGGVQNPPIPSFTFGEHNDVGAGGRDSRQSGSITPSSLGHSRTPSRETSDMSDGSVRNSVPVTRDIPIRQLHINDSAFGSRYSHVGEIDVATVQEDDSVYHPREPSLYSGYHRQPASMSAARPPRDTDSQHSSDESARSGHTHRLDVPLHSQAGAHRPSSAHGLGSELHALDHANPSRLSIGGSPASNGSASSSARPLSGVRRSHDVRPASSYVDLLNLPYNQQIAPAANFGNAALRGAVGQNASLLDTKKTLDMYRANVKKTQDTAVQYEFALFMVQVAREILESDPSVPDQGLDPTDMLREARQILQKLADRSYPFALYYLADGYASGLFNKGKPDLDRAFPLLFAAAKYGHAESGYRTALCYEFGWGCRKDYAKAVQFHRAAASKNHPGAATRLGKACLTGDMGLHGKYREGVKWLKRASESADRQYNNAPYELGVLHETGYGDDIFKDEIYAVQLFTQAAELGHAMAALKLGEAYEHGYLCCPKDAALSVHYYNCAAQADIPEAMMNLCAWYMVGAEPVLAKDENEAYEWAKKAAEHGLPKAEYACGYFTEMGIGCRRDALEANVWYVKSADHGDERAKQRLAVIQATASGQSYTPDSTDRSKLKKGGKDNKDENCVVM